MIFYLKAEKYSQNGTQMKHARFVTEEYSLHYSNKCFTTRVAHANQLSYTNVFTTYMSGNVYFR